VLGLLITFLVVLAAAGSGSVLLRRFDLVPLERFVYGGALGLGLLSYTVFVLGLLHLLGYWLLLPVVLMAITAIRGWRILLQDFHFACPILHKRDYLTPLLRMLIAALLLISLVMVWLPPDANDWDGIAYHLAAPKIHLRNGGIGYIPFIHQSNFPALLDTLYMWGLWANGEACAKAFHWWMWLLTLLGTSAFVARLGGRGEWAMLMLAATPVAIWQAGVAYIDLSTTLYVALSVFALYRCAQDKNTRWLLLAGVMMGFALGTKYTALLNWGVLGLVGLAQLIRMRWWVGVRTLVIAGILALAIGSPWYIKNFLYTGNPVYPFAYEIFGGRNWSQANADAYRGDQLKFGLGREPYQLLLLPWNMTTHPQAFVDPLAVPIGERYYLLGTSGAAYLAGLYMPVASGLPPGIGWLAGFALLNTVGWFYLMQQVRYLLPIFPLLAVFAVCRLHLQPLWLRTSFLGLLIAQSLYCLWLFGTVYVGRVPEALQDRAAYLRARIQPYTALEFLNQNTPPGAKVITYDEPRCFYLDRDYIWGDPGHHRLIPYERFQNASQLMEGLKRMGFTHVLINRRFWPAQPQESWRIQIEQAIQEGMLQLIFSAKGEEVYAISKTE
jgi:hypothetical protein